MDGRVDHVIAGVHLDHDRLLFHTVAQVKLLKDQVEFRRQGFFCFEPRLACRTEEYFGWVMVVSCLALDSLSLHLQGFFYN